jgi:uncharacterized metal-binding protein
LDTLSFIYPHILFGITLLTRNIYATLWVQALGAVLGRSTVHSPLIGPIVVHFYTASAAGKTSAVLIIETVTAVTSFMVAQAMLKSETKNVAYSGSIHQLLLLNAVGLASIVTILTAGTLENGLISRPQTDTWGLFCT